MNYPNELVEAVKAVADAINGEGGGGGESDFSIAHITVSGFSGDLSISGAFTNYVDGVGNFSMGNNSIDFSNNIILYKGQAVIDVASAPDSVSGNIRQLSGNTYLVTGDCTLNYNSINQ